MGLHILDGASTEGLCFLDSLGSVQLNLMEGHAKVRDLILCLACREDLVTNRQSRALLASSWSWTTSKGGASPLGPEVSTRGSRETCISSNVGSSISAPSGILTLEEVSTRLVESFSLRGSAAAKAKDPGLFGVELPDTRPEVSRTA